MKNSFCVILISLVAASCDPSAELDRAFASPDCPSTARIDTQDWQQLPGSRYTYQLPRSYEMQPDRHVDSDVVDWKTSDGRTITSDYGFYTGSFGASPRFVELVECHAAENGGPQIVTYKTEAGVGAGLYWIVPNGRTLEDRPGRMLRLSLWMVAESPRSEDLPELLAIIRSARVY